MAILRRESRGIFGGNAVLIPRNLRKNGRVYLSDEPLFVSTNFFVCNLPDADKALTVASWMATVFYQLICEVSCKDQEGTRKMESSDILKTLVPKLDDVSETLLRQLRREKHRIEFLDLKRPVVREIDRIWARELFGANADTVLRKACELLGYVASNRDT